MPVDPYTPPPRHKDGSGKIVRAGIMAVLLGGAAFWGYSALSDPNAPSLTESAELEQTQEQAVADAGYSVTPQPTTSAPASPAAAPAESTPQPARAPAVPPPSTTIGDVPPA